MSKPEFPIVLEPFDLKQPTFDIYKGATEIFYEMQTDVSCGRMCANASLPDARAYIEERSAPRSERFLITDGKGEIYGYLVVYHNNEKHKPYLYGEMPKVGWQNHGNRAAAS